MRYQAAASWVPPTGEVQLHTIHILLQDANRPRAGLWMHALAIEGVQAEAVTGGHATEVNGGWSVEAAEQTHGGGAGRLARAVGRAQPCFRLAPAPRGALATRSGAAPLSTRAWRIMWLASSTATSATRSIAAAAEPSATKPTEPSATKPSATAAEHAVAEPTFAKPPTAAEPTYAKPTAAKPAAAKPAADRPVTAAAEPIATGLRKG